MESKIIILPEAITALVNSSWDYANENLFSRCVLVEEEKEHIKSCIKHYYWSIPADKFCEISGQYFEAFCSKVLHAKEYFEKGEEWKVIDPTIGFILRFEYRSSNLLAKKF